MADSQTKADTPVALGCEGYYCIPLQPGKKTPAVKGWPAWATRDEAKLRAHWTANPDHNIGIVTGMWGDDGQALIVVDVDTKDSRDGAKTVTELDLKFGFPETREHRTASGGVHLIYKADAPVKQGADVLGPGVDIRSKGGYIVAPGSVVDGNLYEISNSAPIAQAPTWLIEKCGQARESKPTESLPTIDVPADAAAARALSWLDSLPAATEGNRNDSAYKAACQLKDFGVAPDNCFALMAEHWRCEPRLPDEELQTAIGSAFKTGQNAPGSASPEADFAFPLPAETPERAKKKFTIRHLREIKPRLDQRWLIDGVIPAGGLTMLCAQPKKGKSFCAIDLSMAIARGILWHGRPTSQGTVIYAALDAPIDDRVTAYLLHHKISGEKIPFGVVGDYLNFAEGGHVAPFIEEAKRFAEAAGSPLALVIFDTLARTVAGADENSAKDMGTMLARVGRIQRDTGAAVLLVHHEGKDASRGARGSSALFGAVDADLTIQNQVLKVKDLRDGESGARFGFELLPVIVGQDGQGKDISSCVAVPNAEAEFLQDRIRPDSVTQKALTILEDLTMNGSEICLAKWRDEFITANYPKNKKTGRKNFGRAADELIAKGYIVVEGEHVARVQ